MMDEEEYLRILERVQRAMTGDRTVLAEVATSDAPVLLVAVRLLQTENRDLQQQITELQASHG